MNSKTFETLEGCKVILVEDNDILRNSVSVTLETHGCVVHNFEGGSQASEIIAANPDVDLIVSDIRMPDPVNGVALAKWVAENYPEIPVILFSGYHDKPLEFEDIKFLEKPFHVNELIDVIIEVLGNRPSRD